MDMGKYLSETRFAVEELMKIIRAEEKEIKKLEEIYGPKKERLDYLYNDFFNKDSGINENIMHDANQAAFIKQAKYQELFGDKIKKAEKKISELESSMAAKESSIATLSGGVLQIAKQGISTIYGKVDNCKNGRKIKDEFLKNIIWQGRNQSMHFEDKRDYLDPVKDTFSKLGYDVVPDTNEAKVIIDLLGWTNYASYEKDMKSLVE